MSRTKTTKTKSQNLSVADIVATAPTFRPESLILSDIKWKYLVRSVLRGQNLMITGPAGSGKTLAVRTVADAMDRPFYYFNLGSTQDPRTALIGTTHFDKESGTYFNQSTFIKAIQIPDAVILLDELSRAHPEAWNILMTVLDDGQRYVRVDESPDAEVIKVAPGVSFLATANIGVEYTSTRVIDRAIQDRFLILEMDLLDKTQQGKLINYVCPNLNEQTVDILSSIYTQVYNEVLSGHGKVSTTISTRTILRAAALICDGFTIGEALEVCVFPYFTEEGGADSERTYVRQIVQKFIPIDSLDNDNMFDEGDTAKK